MLARIFALLCAVASFAASAQDDSRALMERGVQAYEDAQELTDQAARSAAFAAAARLFTQAAELQAGNADLYANAGTAALQAERLGPAVLAFRRALAVNPDHARARRNLIHARSLLPKWVPTRNDASVLDSFFFWHRTLSSHERAGAAAMSFLLAAVLLAIAIVTQSRVLRGIAILPALVWIGLVISLAVELSADKSSAGVIVADETQARASDSGNAPARFSQLLPGGTEVEIVERRARWTQIRLNNGRDGWVDSNSVVPVHAQQRQTNQ